MKFTSKIFRAYNEEDDRWAVIPATELGGLNYV